MTRGDDERIDINLDAEVVGESPLDSVLKEAVATVAPASAAVPIEEGAQKALLQQLGRLQAEKDDLTTTLIRRQADFENFRKRVEREKKDDATRALMPLIETLLPVLDAFERALLIHGDPAIEEFRKGFELIHRQLWEALGKFGLERIAAKGLPFDPHLHQAVERVETPELPDHTVLEEMQTGYKLRDRVLRPTFVKVAVTPAENQNPPVN
ncbi:MAG: nucleotide exchange factor GrpE [Acidobacteria bacterium]|nr:nucleotide exchange factor GrpE [Acidobacteriota bacterium]